MPEIPDLAVYVEHLERRLVGEMLAKVRVAGWNLLRTAEPPLAAAEGRRVSGIRRVGKRLVFALDGGPLLALHLMISGRLHWRAGGAALPKPTGLGAFVFPAGPPGVSGGGPKESAGSH